MGFIIKIMKVFAKNFSGINSQRAIHIDGHRGQFAFANHAIEAIDDLLRATDSEGWHHHVPPALNGALDDIAEFLIRLFRIIMLAVPIGAFH